MENKKLLPLGSIVLLESGMQKLVVIGRGVIYHNQELGKDVLSDYIGAAYPAGMNPESAIFFQHQDIDKVIFEGYRDEDEDRFLEIYKKWIEDLKLN